MKRRIHLYNGYDRNKLTEKEESYFMSQVWVFMQKACSRENVNTINRRTRKRALNVILKLLYCKNHVA